MASYTTRASPSRGVARPSHDTRSALPSSNGNRTPRTLSRYLSRRMDRTSPQANSNEVAEVGALGARRDEQFARADETGPPLLHERGTAGEIESRKRRRSRGRGRHPRAAG